MMYPRHFRWFLGILSRCAFGFRPPCEHRSLHRRSRRLHPAKPILMFKPTVLSLTPQRSCGALFLFDAVHNLCPLKTCYSQSRDLGVHRLGGAALAWPACRTKALLCVINCAVGVYRPEER